VGWTCRARLEEFSNGRIVLAIVGAGQYGLEPRAGEVFDVDFCAPVADVGASDERSVKVGTQTSPSSVLLRMAADAEFRDWVADLMLKKTGVVMREKTAAAVVQYICIGCGVSSVEQLDTSEQALAVFRERIETPYARSRIR
jgi:hypothetical protein